MPVVFPRDKFITRSRELGEEEKEEEERNHRDSERGREREEYQFFVDGIVNALAFLDYAVTRFRRSISTALGGYLSRLDPLFFATDLDQVSILRSDHDHGYAIRIIFAGQTTCVSANETATRIFNGEFIQSRVDFFKYLLSRKTVNPSSVDEARVTTTTLTDFPRRDL